MLFNKLRRLVFSISQKETDFSHRGFRIDNEVKRKRLEKIASSFVKGYHASLETNQLNVLSNFLNKIDLDMQGFAFEGAAMGLYLLDFFTPWSQSRWQDYINGPAQEHIYISYIGVGWALARLPVNVENSITNLDPLLKCLVIDGYGFHEGFFHWERYKKSFFQPHLSKYGKRVFDQGLGRSLWFIECANVQEIANTIAKFPCQRHSDLWSGIGLACAYAGGVNEEELEQLKESSKNYKEHLLQGVTFATKARQKGGNICQETELACKVLANLPTKQVAQIADFAFENLTQDEENFYESWRKKIRAEFM